MGLIMLSAMAGLPANAQGITTRVLSTQQLVGLRENVVYNGEWGFTTTLSYMNLNNPATCGWIWGGDLGFAFVAGSPYLRPVNAHFMGGWHKTWDHFRVYGAATLGVGEILLHQELSNQFFEEVKNQRQFTPTVGALAAIGWQGSHLGINLLVSWDYNIFKVPEMSENELMTLDVQKCYRNPLSVALQVNYSLQGGNTRQDGDRSWRGGLGYTFGFGETVMPRTIVRLGKTVRQSGKWSGEYGMQFEYNYSKSYTAATLTYEETFLPIGSRSLVRPFVGAKFGFCNVLVSSDSYAHSEQPGGTGDLWSTNYNMQPGFVLGGMIGVDVRLFGRLHLDASVGFDRCWTSKPKTEGFDESQVSNVPMNLWGASVGLRYTL